MDRLRRSRDELRLGQLLERADPFMAWLGVMFALLVLFELAVPLQAGAARTVEVVGWSIWVVFVVEFLAHLYVAERPLLYVRRNWVQVLALLVPTLRFLRFVRLIRLGRALPAARLVSSSYRVAGSSRRLLRTRLQYLAAVSAVVVVLVAELAFLFERDSSRAVFPGFMDALVWAAAVVLAMQGDPTPSDPLARLVMLGGFMWGLVVIGTVAGSIGSYLVGETRHREGVDGTEAPELLHTRERHVPVAAQPVAPGGDASHS